MKRNKPIKLDPEIFRQICSQNYGKEPGWDIGTLQVVLYVMVGGGMIGRLYAEQPADAYRDSRAGRAPYMSVQIENVRQALVCMAESQGLNPHSLPRMPNFPGCGVF